MPAAAPDTGAVPGVDPSGSPLAIIPLGGIGGQSSTVTGALEVTGDKAVIASSCAVTAGNVTIDVTLAQRGVHHVCASTAVKLAAETFVPKDETPGLLLALDQGAVEANLTNGRNSDVVLTPDFRILISGPGLAEFSAPTD